MSDSTPQRYRYWGECQPVMLARPAETVEMAAGARKTAKMRLYGPIDSWGAPFGVAASEVADALDQAGDTTAIELHVHSPGGDAFEGLAIMNLLRQHKGGVDIIVDGLAASAASIVAMGAATVTMAPGSQMMIHDASALAIGQADDMREAATMLDSISSNAADQYAAKSGKPADEIRAAMKATSWYKAQQAVDAGLADAVLEPDTEQAKAAQTAAASLRFDLSIYPHAPEMSAPQTPAEPPETQHTHTEEAVTMTETEIKALRERLGLAEDADAATINAKLDELEEQATKPAASADDSKLDAKAIASALEAEGKVVMSKLAHDELTEQAKAGASARAKQLEDERDETVQAAVTAGKISRERVDAWKASWDKDPEGTKADLESLPSRFPVAKLPGSPGGENESSTAVFSDDEAGAVAALAGVSKEGLLA